MQQRRVGSRRNWLERLRDRAKIGNGGGVISLGGSGCGIGEAFPDRLSAAICDVAQMYGQHDQKEKTKSKKKNDQPCPRPGIEKRVSSSQHKQERNKRDDDHARDCLGAL